jgi:chemotaxis protein methyltransferase WspC
MSLTDFKSLLRETIGLDAASIGDAGIEQAIRQRQRATQLPETARYWALVSTSRPELQSLIEAVVVPETWFFRDRDAFGELTRCVLERLRTQPSGTVKLLSLPCSTGEEPYSIAMALLDAGVPPSRFRIDAVDVSQRALAHAQRGVYGKGSFRGADLAFRDRHFTTVATGHSIADVVRRQVGFQQGNLFSPTFLPGLHIYDVVFCRNVLIYFDRDTQARAVTVLSRVLASTGLLFVGPSETAAVSDRFVPTPALRACAFRAAQSAPKPAPRGRATTTPWPIAHQPPPRVQLESPPPPRTVVSSVALDEAYDLANRGQFIEAADYCRVHIETQGPSAEAYHLLGLVRDASGHVNDAVECYRKALYLNPHHQDTLAHLALLMDAQGQPAEAQVLRARAQRLARKGA